MKRLAKFLIRLYPGDWRARYGDEFQTLLEDAPPDWRGTLDLMKGALQTQSSVRNFPRLALVLSGIGMLVGLGLSFLVTPRYKSSAIMALSAPWIDKQQPHRSLADLYSRLTNEVLSRTSLFAVIQDPRLDLYVKARVTEPLEDVIETMRRKDIAIEPLVRPGLSGQDWFGFRITFAYSDPRKTQQTVQTLLTKFQEANFHIQKEAAQSARADQSGEIYRLEARIVELERRLGVPNAGMEVSRGYLRNGPGTGIDLEVLDPPSLPELPAWPNRAAFALTGFGAGLGMAVLLALLRRTVPVAQHLPV